MFDTRRARFGFWLMVCSLSCFACAREPTARRLALHALETRTLAGEDLLELSGDALPLGASLTLELRGSMHAAGASDTAIDQLWSARVLSPERLTAWTTAPAAEVLGRGTFEGGVAVRGQDSDGARLAGALARVTFDVEGSSALSSEHLRQSSLTLLRTVGLEISDDASLARGLLVAHVEANGPAARAGLRVGDVIEFANGVRIHALGDFAPAPQTSTAQLLVKSAQGQRRIISVPLSAAPFADAHWFGLCVLGCSISLWLLRVSPWSTPRALWASGMAALRVLRQSQTFAGDKLSVILPVALAGASALWFELRDVFVILLVQLGLLLAIHARRSTRWLAPLGHASAIALGVGCVAALSGTRAWSGIVLDQGALPWEWNLFARPPLTLACVWCVWHAARLQATLAAPGLQPSAAREAQATHFIDSLARGVLAVLFGALFLGGSVSGVFAGRESFALGIALAASKSLLMFGLLGVEASIPKRVNTSLLCALLVTSGFWLWLAPTRSFEVALGAAVCTFLALGMLLTWIERRIARNAASALPTGTAQLS
jgi:hypothetical protein